MELYLAFLSFGAFSLLPAAAPMLLRCGLAASLRFSPRAALALSSLAALAGCASMLLCRGGLRAVPLRQRAPVAAAAVLGGTIGRMLLLLFTARFPGSLALGRIQSVPLVLLAAVSAFPHRLPLPASRAGLFAFSLLCAACEGFFGCGGAALFLLAGHSGVRRQRFSPSGTALLLVFSSQLCALLLTHLCGAAEIFPIRLSLSLAAAAALGGTGFETAKKRNPIKKGLRKALYIYVILAALAVAEQAFLSSG